MASRNTYNWDTELPEELWEQIIPRLVPGVKLHDVLELQEVSSRFERRVMSPGVFREADLSILDQGPYEWQCASDSPARRALDLAVLSGNLDSVFREGMMKMYCRSRTELEEGMRQLKRAADGGHVHICGIHLRSIPFVQGRRGG